MGFSSDHRLLAGLLSRTQCEHDPEKTARMLLSHYGSLQAMVECLPTQDDSLPLAQNTRLLLTMIPALCRRREIEKLGKHPLLNTLEAASQFVSSLYIGVQYEKIYLICLDEQLRLIKVCPMGEGGVREVSFYPRRLMEEALACNAQAVILCHNHLSSWCFFSEADLTATKEFLKLCTYVQIALLDHLLVAGDQVSSMRSKAHIPNNAWCAASPLMPTLGQWRSADRSGNIEILPTRP